MTGSLELAGSVLQITELPGLIRTEKDRFLDEIWRGVPVTDEALTQCIRTLRRQLGDNVAKPRLIETVPKHGYRFIATVKQAEDGDAIVTSASQPAQEDAPPYSRRQCLLLAAAGTTGAGVSLGIAASGLLPGRRWRWSIAGGAAHRCDGLAAVSPPLRLPAVRPA